MRLPSLTIKRTKILFKKTHNKHPKNKQTNTNKNRNKTDEKGLKRMTPINKNIQKAESKRLFLSKLSVLYVIYLRNAEFYKQ